MPGNNTLIDTVLTGEDNKDFRTKVVVLILAAVSCLLINLPWYTLLATDTVMPEYAGWVLPGLLFLVMAFSGRMVFTRAPWLLLSFLILSFPLLWMAPHADVWRAISRVLMMWCGGVFLLWLSACRVSEAVSAFSADALIVIGLVCALSVLLMVLWPAGYAHWLPLQSDMRPSGGFRQVNLMASFLATALALSLHRWLLSGRRCFLLPLAVLMVAVVWTQSTIGMLGVMVVSCLLTVAGWRVIRRRLCLALAVLVSAWGIARLTMVLMSLSPFIDHTDSRAARLQMWHSSLQLIWAHPWSGVGYGMFEGEYPQGLSMLHETSLTGMLTHPHNELLYWLTEGGLVTAIGLSLLLAWGVRMSLRLWRQGHVAGGYGQPGSDATGLAICTLPVLLHTQTEYPWYQSGVHFVLFLFLAGLALSRLVPAAHPLALSPRLQHPAAILLALVGVFLVWFSLSGTVVRVGIDAAKRTMATDISLFERVRWLNPWFMPDQQAFVVSLHDMQLFNQDGDPARLRRAVHFYRDYLVRHPDPNVYAMYLQVLTLQGDTTQAQRVYNEARWRAGWDSRFGGGQQHDEREEQ
ncbi:Wzy polymerase domain-containing protein [Enterobacter ludwigii]|uniref:PglL family O-oligosaccharyltransferase n=1 Tax=Enterobacter ludwigii TaxID=299767 RepID=UPI00243245C3|nr:O-antigen ligase family protein [Enterobacter ludwigii]WGA03945.1 Wzy polymerase domain-containing protein [Enterobacter ludwigii]